MTTKKISNKRRKRIEDILKLIGKGLNSEEIAVKLEISLRTYFYDVHHLKKRLKDKKYMDEACIKVMSRRDESIRQATLQYKQATDSKTKIQALQTLNKINDSTEKTYARIGLIPIEKSGIDLAGEIDHDITVTWKKKEKDEIEDDKGDNN